jgi:hypothetical protein
MDGGKAWEICFVIARPRSGTTVFKELLASHPLCFTLGEAFNEGNPHALSRYLVSRAAHEPEVVLPRRSVPCFLDWLGESCAVAAREKPGARIVVVDLKSDQAHLIHEEWWHVAAPPRLFSLIKEHGWKVIDLRRRDLLALVVSSMVATATRTYHSFDLAEGTRQTARIRVEPRELLSLIRATEAGYRLLSGQFKAYSGHLGLIYEDLFDPSGRFSGATLARLAAFLGVENRFDPAPRLEKLLTGDIFSYVENADEVKAFLAANPP